MSSKLQNTLFCQVVSCSVHSNLIILTQQSETVMDEDTVCMKNSHLHVKVLHFTSRYPFSTHEICL